MMYKNLSISNLFKSIIYFLNPRSNLNYWKNKTINSGNSYLSNINDPNTHFFLQEFDFSNLNSVLEIGCNSGNRLFHYAQKYPDINFFGIDIDFEAIQLGREYCKKNHIKNVKLIFGDMNKSQDFLGYFPNGVDLVCTWATLIYLHPKFTSKFFNNLNGLVKQYFLFIEIPSNKKIYPLFLGHIILGTRNIARNYDICISKFAPKLKITKIIPVSKSIWSPGGRTGGVKIIGQAIQN